MARGRLKVSQIDGRYYRYPYPIHYRSHFRWNTPSFSARKVAVVSRDFGSEIQRAINKNDVDYLQTILEGQLWANFFTTKMCTTDIGDGIASRRSSCLLIVAARKKDPTMLRYMLEKGADPNHVEHRSCRPYSYCALHVAARLGLLEAVATLLNSKANPNTADSRGETPLHISVRLNNYALAKLLLSHGADPNAKDGNGNTSLHIATNNGHMEMVNLLMTHGADLKLPSLSGFLPIHVAAAAGHAHLISTFFVADKSCANALCVVNDIKQMPLHLAAENGHAEVVHTLLDSRANVNAKDSEGNTALHRLVLKPYQAQTMGDMDHFFGTALTLLKAGIGVNDQNNNGETALTLAAENRFPRVATLILSSGGKQFRLEPEMTKKILVEQRIIKSNDQQITAVDKDRVNRDVTSSEQILVSNEQSKTLSVHTSSNLFSKKDYAVKYNEESSKNYGKEPKPYSKAAEESQPQKEVQSDVSVSYEPVAVDQEPEDYVKRYPIPKSDLRNYQQFRPGSTIENEISTFTVASNKGAERMCIVFDKSSPSNRKVTTTRRYSPNEPFNFQPSSDTSQAKRLKGTSETTAGNVQKTNDPLEENVFLRKNNKLVKGEEQERSGSSNFPLSNSMDPGTGMIATSTSETKNPLKLAKDDIDEDENSCWIEYHVERDSLLYPVVHKSNHRHSASSFRHYSKSPSGFLSEGGGLRGLKLRVAGHVPKAYTCKQKAAARRAFFVARPVGIESVGDYDRTHLSMSSLPEIGGEAWEKAMLRRLEWSEPLKPFFTKEATEKSKKKVISSEFSPTDAGKAVRVGTPERAREDYRISGLFPQPYKSFGKIETKTDALEEAMMDYDSDEEYESDNDVEPLTNEWIDRVTEHRWDPNASGSVEHFDKVEDDSWHFNDFGEVLNESINSVKAEEIFGLILNGEAKSNFERETNMQHLTKKMDVIADLEAKSDAEVDENQTNADQRKAASVRSNSFGLLHLLHGYHPKGTTSDGSTTVVCSLQPEIQRLTSDNLVYDDSYTSDDQENEEPSDRHGTMYLPGQSSLQLEKYEDRKKNTSLEKADAESEERLKSTKKQPSVVTSEIVSTIKLPQIYKDMSQSSEDKEEEIATAIAITDEELEENGFVMIDKDKVPDKHIESDGGEEENYRLNENDKLTEQRQLEEPEKKVKKVKKSAKKPKAETNYADEFQDVINEDKQDDKFVTQVPAKRKKKQKIMLETEEYRDEPRSRVKSHTDQKEADDQLEVVEDISYPEKYTGSKENKEEMSYNNYAEEPGKRHWTNEEKRIQEKTTEIQKELQGREKKEEILHDVYVEQPQRRKKKKKEQIEADQEERRKLLLQYSDEQPVSGHEKDEEETIIDIKGKEEIYSDEQKVTNDVHLSQQMYDKEPGSRRKPKEKVKESRDEILNSSDEKPLKKSSDQGPAKDTKIKKSKTAKSKQQTETDIPPGTDFMEQSEIVAIEDQGPAKNTKIKKSKTAKSKQQTENDFSPGTDFMGQSEIVANEENLDSQESSELQIYIEEPSGKRKDIKKYQEMTEMNEGAAEGMETSDAQSLITRGKKEKSTDCDSALIPLLCVHG